MPLPSEIQIVPLDFDTIRTDLRRFLQNQTLLKDYNYEGSALSTLIDLMAYDAYYHGWYTNFAVNEVFLQTAQIRNSVVAAARQIGYIPRSISSAVALVDVTLSGIDTTEVLVELPRYTKFSANTTNTIFNFYTIEDTTQLTFAENVATFRAVELYEGVKLSQTFTISTSDIQSSGVKLTLPNKNIDTRTITVAVKPQENSTTSFTYPRAQAGIAIGPSSNVYFLFENNQGNYDIQFGDGRIGQNLTVGQVVNVDYLISSGVDGNGANNFVFADSLTKLVENPTNVTITTTLNNINIPAAGGDVAEDIESIKKNAPAVYQVQGRIVTPDDARTILLTEYNGIESLSIWGGEDNDPPMYGKMFIAMKPVNGEKFGLVQKTAILNRILRPRALPIMGFEFVDPDYIYIPVDILAKYSPALTSRNTSELASIITDAVVGYTTTTLGQFGSIFRYSQLSKLIDTSENSIQSNLTGIKLEKRFRTSEVSGSYTLEFSNALLEANSTNQLVAVTSKIGSQRFSHVDMTQTERQFCYVENSGNVLNVYRDDITEGKLLVKQEVGTVNFETGKVTFTGFYPTNISTNFIGEMRIQVLPRMSDIFARRSQIIRIAREGINVRVEPDLLDRRGTTVGRVVNGAIVF